MNVESVPKLREINENEIFQRWRLSSGPEKEMVYQELCKELWRHANRVCWGLLNENRPDVVNDAVWKATNEAERFRGESLFSTWFHRIVINLCNDALRERLERKAEKAIEDLSSGENEQLSTETHPESKIDLERLIESLSLEDRRLIQLHRIGLTDLEIARELGIEHSAAKVRWHRLKERIRDAG